MHEAESFADPADWLNAAMHLPLAFAQVREDPLVDLAAVARVAKPARIVMVASGGCTAAALAASNMVASLHLVDQNPAQLALSRLKLKLLGEEVAAQRRAILGHSAMPATERKERLGLLLAGLNLAPGDLGPIDFVAARGPDYAGRYEQLFLALQDALGPHKRALESLFRSSRSQGPYSPASVDSVVRKALDSALADVMALPNLVKLFGEQATRNPVTPFDRHFGSRIRHTLATLPADDNPWLWQMLLGRFPASAAYPWLDAEAPSSLPAVTWEVNAMQPMLAAYPNEFDFVHLSNILDWLTPEDAAQTLESTHLALRRGGCVLVRQLNSILDIPALGPQFHWSEASARELHARDRSFFYRALHCGFKS